MEAHREAFRQAFEKAKLAPEDRMAQFVRMCLENLLFLAMLLQYRQNHCITAADEQSFDKIMDYVVINYYRIVNTHRHHYDWLICQLMTFTGIPDCVFDAIILRSEKGLPVLEIDCIVYNEAQCYWTNRVLADSCLNP